jgi:hypothetical protein
VIFFLLFLFFWTQRVGARVWVGNKEIDDSASIGQPTINNGTFELNGTFGEVSSM